MVVKIVTGWREAEELLEKGEADITVRLVATRRGLTDYRYEFTEISAQTELTEQMKELFGEPKQEESWKFPIFYEDNSYMNVYRMLVEKFGEQPQLNEN